MEKLIAKAYVERAVESEEGVLEAAVASTGIVDRYGEIVAPEGWDIANFKKNPMLLWGHNAQEYRAPIGKVEHLWVEGQGDTAKLMFKPRFDMEDEFARDIYRKFQKGFLNAFSVGFKPVETDITKDNNVVYTKSELLEISAVAVPANPEALVALKGAGIKTEAWEDMIKEDEIRSLISEVKDLKEEVRALTSQSMKPKKEEKKGEEKVTTKQLQDIIRILNQATSIALKQIKEVKE